MHEKLESINPLLKAGEYKKAVDALKEYQTEFPDDWDGKLMEGIIAKLQGNEETFHRIHDEAKTVIEADGKAASQIKASPLWKKYHSAWKKVATVAIIMIVATMTAVGIAHISSHLSARIKWISEIIVYGDPPEPGYPSRRIWPERIPEPRHPLD